MKQAGKYNILGGRCVPIFLALSLSLACDPGPDSEIPTLTADENAIVDYCLQLIEIRGLDFPDSITVDSLSTLLPSAFPADSLRALASEVTRKDARRWIPIYEEIVRRGKIAQGAASDL